MIDKNFQITNYKIENINFSDNKKLKDICKEFEAIFLYQLLQQMRKTIPKDENNFFGNSRAEEFFTEMFDEELSKHLAKTNSIGIAELLYKQLNQSLY